MLANMDTSNENPQELSPVLKPMLEECQRDIDDITRKIADCMCNGESADALLSFCVQEFQKHMQWKQYLLDWQLD